MSPRTAIDFIQRVRDERRSVPRPDSIDRRGRVPTSDGSPWVRLALLSQLPAGGAMPTLREKLRNRSC